MKRAALLLLGVAATCAAPALAQQQRRSPPPAAAPAPPPEPPRTVYEPLLLELSEIMGALSIMTELCRQPGDAGPMGEAWRIKMQNLLDAEGQHQALKERLAGAFNRGALTYRTTYRVCTPAGRVALQRLLSDGARLSGEISSRFGT